MFQAHCRGFALRKMLSEQEAQNKSLRRTVVNCVGLTIKINWFVAGDAGAV
jgi:hypothetical protein